MSQPFIGQIMLFAGNFVPLNYLACDGSLQAISQYDALFNLIGTTYGGDGVNTFAMPDMRSRVPLGMGQGGGLSPYVLGQNGGTEQVTLTTAQLPVHTHSAATTAQTAGVAQPATSVIFANQNNGSTVQVYGPYDSAGQTALAGAGVGQAGGGGMHENRQPLLAMTFCIAAYGVYPSQG